MEKIVVNRAYGGFQLPKAFRQKYNINSPYPYIERNDERLVQFVEEHPELSEALEVVVLEDDCTDYTIVEYDGSEEVYVVYHGKIYIL